MKYKIANIEIEVNKKIIGDTTYIELHLDDNIKWRLNYKALRLLISFFIKVQKDYFSEDKEKQMI